jgi:hypothetical protein
MDLDACATCLLFSDKIIPILGETRTSKVYALGYIAIILLYNPPVAYS